MVFKPLGLKELLSNGKRKRWQPRFCMLSLASVLLVSPVAAPAQQSHTTSKTAEGNTTAVTKNKNQRQSYVCPDDTPECRRTVFSEKRTSILKLLRLVKDIVESDAQLLYVPVVSPLTAHNLPLIDFPVFEQTKYKQLTIISIQGIRPPPASSL